MKVWEYLRFQKTGRLYPMHCTAIDNVQEGGFIAEYIYVYIFIYICSEIVRLVRVVSVYTYKYTTSDITIIHCKFHRIMTKTYIVKKSYSALNYMVFSCLESHARPMSPTGPPA